MRCMSTHVRNDLGPWRAKIALALCVVSFGILFYQHTFKPARDDARRANCVGNLIQIGLAMAQYAEHNDETLPRAWFGKNDGPSDAKTNYKWMDAILPYVKDEKLFVCPDDNVNPPYHFRSGTNYGSYLWNNAYYATGDKFSPPTGRRLSQVADFNSVLIMEGDGGFQFSWPDVQSAPPLPQYFEAPFDLAGVATRHTHRGGLKTATTLWIVGLAQNYSMRQNTAPKTINGRNVYTGLTIEKD